MKTVGWAMERRINEGERRERGRRQRRGGEEGRRGEEWWGGGMENGSLMGGTVDRRVDKGMGGKMEGGWKRERERLDGRVDRGMRGGFEDGFHWGQACVLWTPGSHSGFAFSSCTLPKHQIPLSLGSLTWRMGDR